MNAIPMTGYTDMPDAKDRTSRATRVQTVRSPAGIEAWLVEDYAVPLVSVSLGFKGGAAQDPAGLPGVATMLAALLEEGAGPLDSAAFQEALDDDAIEMSFSADRDNLRGSVRTLARNAERAFDLLGLAVREARLDPDAIERVGGRLASTLRSEASDPGLVAGALFRRHAFPDHPYGAPVRGDLAALPRIGRDDLAAMRGRTMTRDNLKLGVVGAIDAATLAERLDTVFAGLPAQAERMPVAAVELSGTGGRHIAPIALPQSTIQFGRRGIRRDDPDFMAATVVNHCLGGGVFTSRLFKEVREKRGLCYAVGAHNQTFDQAALFVGATSTRNERVSEAIAVIRAEIERIAREGVEAAELDKAKSYLIGSYDLRFDTSSKIAGHLIDLQLEDRAVAWLDERNTRIASVTMADSVRAARRLYSDGDLLIAIAGQPVDS